MLPLRGVADSLAARGIRRITGHVVPAGDAFPGPTYGFGWGYDDLDYPYSAPTDELTFNEGFWRFRVTAQEAAGAGGRGRTTVVTSPSRRSPAVLAPIDVRARAATGSTANTLAIYHDSTQLHGVRTPVVRITGAIDAGDSATLTLAHRDPNASYRAALVDALTERGIAVDAPGDGSMRGTSRPASDTLFHLLSPPLREVLPHFEKPSQNQIGELLFKTLGLEKTGVGTPDSGRAVVERQLLAWGASRDGFAVRDGSGLSRHDYVTPQTIVTTLDAMRKHPDFRVFYDALPIAGVDGTIASRMRGTPAQGNVHAKTGTVDKARSLSGYVTTADGQLLLFSYLANNFTVPNRAVERVQDAISVRLATLRLADLR